MTEAAWLIERWYGPTLKYWNGKPLERVGGVMDQDRAWTTKHDEALRFAREQDAQVILDRMLGGEGRAVEHAFGLTVPQLFHPCPGCAAPIMDPLVLCTRCDAVTGLPGEQK